MPQQLVEGLRRFRRESFPRFREHYQRLVADGQRPSTLFLGCADSRVVPDLLTSALPGDLFVIRNVANLVPPAENQGNYHGTSAALEFGVRNLKVPHIIVLGHAQCGGIHALLEGSVDKDESFIAGWMGIAEAARKQVEQEHSGASDKLRHRACEQKAILVSLNNLMTFSWIRERVEQGGLTLHGWYFDIECGELLGYDAATGSFETL